MRYWCITTQKHYSIMQKTLGGLILCCLLFATAASSQSTDLMVEQLKHQVQEAYTSEGRDKAVAIALFGNDYVAPNHPEMQRLLYEAYYKSSGYGGSYGYDVDLSFYCADWSPDGRTLAAGLSDGTIRMYSFRNGSVQGTTSFSPTDAMVLDVAISPDGTKIATGGSDGFTRIFDLESKEQLHSWEHPDYIRAVAWSPDGSMLAGGGDDNILFIYNPEDGSIMEEFSSHTDWIRGVSWSSDGDLVAAASDDQSATVWSVSAGALLKKHNDHTDYCRDVVFAPTGESLLTVSDDYYGYIYDPADAELADQSLEGHEGWIFTADWSPNGRMIVTGDNNATLITYNLRGGNSQEFYNDPDEDTDWLDVDWAPDSETFAATSAFHIIIMEPGGDLPQITLPVEGGEEVTENPLDEILARELPSASQIYPSPDGSKLGLIDSDYDVKVIDMNTGAILYAITDHTDWVRNISWSSDGRLLATASDDMIVGIWDANTGEMQHWLDGHTDWVRDVAFSPDNNILVSAGDDGVLRSWDPNSGAALQVTDKVESYLMTCAWSPDQKYLSGQDSEGYMHIWNARTNEKIFRSNGLTISGTMAWHPDNSVTVVSSDRGSIRWADGGNMVTSGAKQGTVSTAPNGTEAKASGPYISAGSAFLEGHIGNVTKMDWSPNSSYLISQDDMGYLAIWEVASSRMVARLQIGTSEPKTMVWATDGQGFYIPGTPDRLLIDPTSLRTHMEENYSGSSLSSEDFQRYELERIGLRGSGVTDRVLANGDASLLNAIADYFEERAEIRPAGADADRDTATAERFRSAASNR